jgi:hypothetical protein
VLIASVAMPIRIVTDGTQTGKPVLFCINHETLLELHQEAADPQNGSTMKMEREWYGLFEVYPPAHLSDQPTTEELRDAIVNAARGQPVRLFACNACGYVELYHGPAMAPNVWKAG